MRFYKEVWGIIWEFNSIGEYLSFCFGRFLGVIIFFGGVYLLVKCDGADTTTEKVTNNTEINTVSSYQYKED